MSRDELIEQAALIVAQSQNRDRWRARDWAIAEPLVDAGWRPPPSSDVIEQARELLRERLWPEFDPHIDCVNEAARIAIETLADAGLLAQPVSQNGPPHKELATAAYELLMLKDGPRDEDYCSLKRGAWERLRHALQDMDRERR